MTEGHVTKLGADGPQVVWVKTQNPPEKPCSPWFQKIKERMKALDFVFVLPHVKTHTSQCKSWWPPWPASLTLSHWKDNATAPTAPAKARPKDQNTKSSSIEGFVTSLIGTAPRVVFEKRCVVIGHILNLPPNFDQLEHKPFVYIQTTLRTVKSR